MKQNFAGVYHQQYNSVAANSNANNHFVFQGYNANMEEATSPTISPALNFGGDHEPLLLPGQGGTVKGVTPQQQQQQQQQSPTELFSPQQIHALAKTYNEKIPAKTYGISSGSNPSNVATVASSIDARHPSALNKNHASVVSPQGTFLAPQNQLDLNQAVMATQKQFAQSIQSSNAATVNVNANPMVSSNPSVVGSFQKTMAAAPIQLSSTAALVAGVGINQPFFFPNHFTAAYLMQKAETPEETEEKRAKRLERNRESARKSRRRKKERLSNLEGKVNKLYSKIEKERRVQINSMDPGWKRIEKEDILELKKLLTAAASQDIDERDREEKLQEGLSSLLIGEKELSIRKEVVEFQYNSLVQHILPRYQKIILWMMQQSASYFLAGKEEHSRRDFSKKITTGKISSKQLGEEISSRHKHELRHGESSLPKSQQQQQGSNQMACVSEAEKFWPLVCFELSVSVEQEERFLELQGR